MLSAANSPLVAGSVTQKENVVDKTVRAIKSFYYPARVRNLVGDTITVPAHVAQELISMNRAELVGDTPPVAPPAAPPAPTADVKKANGGKHV